MSSGHAEFPGGDAVESDDGTEACAAATSTTNTSATTASVLIASRATSLPLTG